MLGLQKTSPFVTTGSDNCPTILRPQAEFAEMTKWMVGEESVDPSLFFDFVVYKFSKCGEDCFTMEVDYDNKIIMRDAPCDREYQIICMESKFCLSAQRGILKVRLTVSVVMMKSESHFAEMGRR